MDLSRTAAIARELERAPLRDTGRVVGGADNVNGALHVLEADTPMGPIAVVSKPMHAQALQEFVVSRSAARFGLAHLSPAIAMHGDDALIEFVTGTLAGEYGTRGIRDIRALDAAIAVTHLDSSPTMAAAMVRGRRDRELLGALDFAKANDDRHPHAVMVEPKRVTAFDGGSVGNGEMPDPLTPRLGPWFQAGGPDSGVVHLHDEAMEVIASIRDEDLVSDLAIYRNAPPRAFAANTLLAGVASDAYRDRVLQRLDQLKTGEYSWTSSIATPAPSPRLLAADLAEAR